MTPTEANELSLAYAFIGYLEARLERAAREITRLEAQVDLYERSGRGGRAS